MRPVGYAFAAIIAFLEMVMAKKSTWVFTHMYDLVYP
jgi:hypothetical protein